MGLRVGRTQLLLRQSARPLNLSMFSLSLSAYIVNAATLVCLSPTHHGMFYA